MTAEAQSLAFPLGGTTAPKKNWIESPLFDLAFFSGSPLVVAPLVALAFAMPRFTVFFFLLSFPHYFSTASFFLWDDYQPRYRARRLAFIGGPIVIAATFFLLIYTGLPKIMQVTLFLWNTFHVSRQSCGILSIYRHRAGVTDVAQKNATNFAIMAANVWLAFWNIDTHAAFDPLRLLRADWSHWTLIVLGSITAIAMLNLAVAIRRRTREGKPMTLAESAFLATSFVIFVPFLFIPSSVGATSVMLLPHYVQYLGIVWLLNRRRFQRDDEGASKRQQRLQTISRSTPMIVAILGTIGVITVASSVLSHRAGRPLIFETFYLLVALEHFYLDGLIWAFRDPAVRRGFGPYLTGWGATPAPPRAS
jgi:hypothetical protein